MKKLMINPFVLVFAITLLATSCKKDGCTDPHASNYHSWARNDNGSCEYIGCTNSDAENYDQWATEDDNSCTFAREKFIGIYHVEDECNSGVYTYSLTIIPDADFQMVVLSNMSGVLPVANVPATIYGDVVTFNDTIGNHFFEGAGTLSGNTLTMSYTLINLDDNIQDNCNFVGIKQ